LVADLGVALEQLGGEHDLVTKGGSLELLLGGEGLQLLRCSAAIPLLAILSGADNPGQLGIRLDLMNMVPAPR
jgi:hypothetical protein